jgi:alpha-L-fucosidase 2
MCPHAISEITTKRNDLLEISGTTIDHEGVKSAVHFKSLIKTVAEGGILSSEGNGIQVKDADTMTIYIRIATNFVNYKDLTADESKSD